MNVGEVDLWFQLWNTIAILTGAGVLIALERMFPYNEGQPLFRKGLFDDVFWYTGVQSYVLAIVITGIITYTDQATAWRSEALLSDWPWYAQLILFFLIHDFYIYWFHRLQHNVGFLWRIHEAHHSNQQVDWIAGSRSHALEILVNQTIEFAPMYLCGVSPEVILLKATIDAVWGMYIHANIDVRSGALQYVINGPEMHRWHHSDGVDEAHNMNFSTKLAVWDFLFGTAFFPKDRKATAYGIGDEYPEGYFRQLLAAFRRE